MIHESGLLGLDLPLTTQLALYVLETGGPCNSSGIGCYMIKSSLQPATRALTLEL